MYVDGKDREEIWDVVGYFHAQEAEAAAMSVNTDNGSVDHIKLCEWAAVRSRAGERLEPVINRWKDGRTKEGDIDILIQVVEDMDKPVSRIVSLADVDAIPGTFKMTNYEPFDHYFGGLPQDSMTVIGGPPGTGKTSICARLMLELAEVGEHSLIFSLEMTLAQLKYRMQEIAGIRVAKKKWKMMHACERVFDITSIMSEAIKFASQDKKLGLIIVDFADMVRGRTHSRDNRVAVIDELYRTFAELALKINTPVVVLSQLNEQHVGGRPRVNHLRGSRLIEALAAMIILLYNPNMIDVNQTDTTLTAGEGIGWFILGKSRYGFGKEVGAPGNLSSTIGAVQVPWKGSKGWGDKGIFWKGLSAV